MYHHQSLLRWRKINSFLPSPKWLNLRPRIPPRSQCLPCHCQALNLLMVQLYSLTKTSWWWTCQISQCRPLANNHQLSSKWKCLRFRSILLTIYQNFRHSKWRCLSLQVLDNQLPPRSSPCQTRSSQIWCLLPLLYQKTCFNPALQPLVTKICTLIS